MFSSIILAAETAIPEAEEMVEVVEKTSFWTSESAKFVILFVILIAVGAYIVIRPNKKQQENAKKYLEDMANNIYKIAIANIEFIMANEGNQVPYFDVFTKEVLDAVYNDSWEFVQTVINRAAEDGKLDQISKRLIKKSSVEALVDLIFSRNDMKGILKQAYDQMSNEFIRNLKEEEAKAKAEADAAEAEEEDPPEPADNTTIELFGDSNTEAPSEEDLTDITEAINIEPEDDDNDPTTLG